MSVLQEYVTAIIENLPEWNHSGAKDNADIQTQIRKFQEMVGKIDTSLETETQLSLLSELITKYVPDNHICIKDKNGTNLRKYPSLSKKQNLSLQNLNTLGITDIHSIQIQDEKDPWIIGTIPSKKLGVVSIPSFGGDIEEQTQKRKQFIETFFHQKEKNNWQSIIFDFRGNTGGDAEVIKEIAERMGNRSVKYADKSERVATLASQKKREEEGALITTLKENAHYRPLSPTDKFSGSIYILQDGYNASATEGAIYMLSQLPKSTTVGENTSGTFAGGATTSLPMSYGSLIVGTEYRERYDKNGNKINEKEGMKPDIPCASENAFSKAFNMIDSPVHLLVIGKINSSR